MREELSPIYMLDKTLQWFSMDTDEMGMGEQLIARENMHRDDAIKLIITMYPELNSNEYMFYYDMILHKLFSEGRLVKSGHAYSITFDGKLFSKAGGYKKQNEIIADAERIKNNREKRLSNGTVLLAVGTFLLVAWEIYKTCFLHRE
jgi:hypothetical protein